MYEQIQEDSLFTILYSAVTTMALLASFYLLLRRANAIAPHITTPQRLRHRRESFVVYADILPVLK